MDTLYFEMVHDLRFVSNWTLLSVSQRLRPNPGYPHADTIDLVPPYDSWMTVGHAAELLVA